jgi:hypothetical protein
MGGFETVETADGVIIECLTECARRVRGNRDTALRVNRVDDPLRRFPPIDRHADSHRDDMDTPGGYLLGGYRKDGAAGDRSAFANMRRKHLVVIGYADHVKASTACFADQVRREQGAVAWKAVNVKIPRDDPVPAAEGGRVTCITRRQRAADQSGKDETDTGGAARYHPIAPSARGQN